MQVRRTRSVAALAIVCLGLAHVVSLRHEVDVAHVHDTTGALEHAHALADFHAADGAQHLHGRHVATHAEAGRCALLVKLEQSTVGEATRIAFDAAQVEAAVAYHPSIIPHAASILSYAPKTSPPRV